MFVSTSVATAALTLPSAIAGMPPTRLPPPLSTVNLGHPTNAPTGGNGWHRADVSEMGVVRVLNTGDDRAVGWCNGAGSSGEEQEITSDGVLAPSGPSKAYFMSKKSQAARASYSLFEWSHDVGTNHLSYDFSDVDANGQNFIPPFVDEGLLVIPIGHDVPAEFDTCETLLCPPGAAKCEAAYGNPWDDIKMHTCPMQTDLVVVIAPSQKLIDRVRRYGGKPMPPRSLNDMLNMNTAVVRKVIPEPSNNTSRRLGFPSSVFALGLGMSLLLAQSLF